MTLEPVGGANETLGGANETVGGATWPEGRATVSTLTLASDLELSRTLAVLRSHNSAADSSVLSPADTSVLLPVTHTHASLSVLMAIFQVNLG